jgi:hypothetical protein
MISFGTSSDDAVGEPRAGLALLFGVLAVRYGDRFWYGLRHLRWFWP